MTDSGRPKVALMTFGDERDYMWDAYFAGLTEPRHAEAREYLGTLPIDLIAKQLLWDVRRFVGLAPQSDDMTLVVLRVR